MTTALIELSQAEREAAAYNNAMAAARLGDRKQHAKLWAEYARICRERSPQVVEALEERMGL